MADWAALWWSVVLRLWVPGLMARMEAEAEGGLLVVC